MKANVKKNTANNKFHNNFHNNFHTSSGGGMKLKMVIEQEKGVVSTMHRAISPVKYNRLITIINTAKQFFAVGATTQCKHLLYTNAGP